VSNAVILNPPASSNTDRHSRMCDLKMCAVEGSMGELSRRRFAGSNRWQVPLEVVHFQSPSRSKQLNLRGAQIIFESKSTVYDKK